MVERIEVRVLALGDSIAIRAESYEQPLKPGKDHNTASTRIKLDAVSSTQGREIL
jgi:hypothetical protein